MKYFLVLFLVLATVGSEAEGLRCYDLFSSYKVGTIEYNADVIDQLNAQANNRLFQTSVVNSLKAQYEGKSLFQQGVARYQAFKLRRLVKQLNDAADWDRYDFENLSKKIERLTYLMDESVVDTLSIKDQVLYRQAQHSFLAKGLERFFFDHQSKANATIRRKIFEAIMMPLKDIYMRWTYAWMMMPKLNGAIMPIEVAEKILWQGLDRHKDLAQPYILQAQTKHIFNIFSVVYNWSVVTAIFVGLPTYGYYVYQDLQTQGNEQVRALFKPVLDSSRQAAEKNYENVTKDILRNSFYTAFERKYQRLPNESEKQLIEVAITRKLSAR